MPIDNSLRIDEEGVSEVVGTILTLLITVTLFTTVFAAVTTLDSPEEREHVEFQAEFNIYEDEEEEEYAKIDIVHEGGEELELDDLDFILIIEDQDFDMSDEDIEHEGDETWTSDETVTIETYNVDIVEAGQEGREIELLIRNVATQRIVDRITLTDVAEDPLSIRTLDINYRFDWRDYAEPGEDVEIRARILTTVDVEIGKVEILDDQVFDEDELILDRVSGNLFNITAQVGSDTDEDRHRLRINATSDDEEHWDEEYFTVNVGEETAGPDRELEIGDVDFTPGSPTHGDELTIRANIYNNYERDIDNVTWSVKDDGELVYEEEGLSFEPGHTPTEITAEFDIMDHGPHIIELTVDWSSDGEMDEGEYATRELTVHVDPHITLVQDALDDDLSEAPMMVNALRGLNLDFSMMEIEDEDDIPENDDEFREELNESSAVIWMSGEREDEIYLEDAAGAIEDFIDEDGGIFWLIGSNLEDEDLPDQLPGHSFDDGDTDGYLEPRDENGTYGDLTYDVLIEEEDGLIIDSLEDDVQDEDLLVDEDEEDDVYGAGRDKGFEGNIDKEEYEGYLEEGEINEELREAIEDEVDEDIDEEAVLSERAGFWVIEENGEFIYRIGIYEDDLKIYDVEESRRTALNSFLFEDIVDGGQRMNMVSEVINWMAMMETRTGVDVAVSSQHIEPTSPMYMDEVEITATLRNNGPEDLYVTVRAERNGGEDVLEPEGDGTVYLPADGGTNTTRFIWEEADELGVQEFLVIADYYNEIDQVTRRNNDITYKDLDVADDMTKVNVHYSTLVVDADGSVGDNDYYNVTAELIDSFDELGHVEEGDVDVDEVEGYPQIYEYYPVEDPQDEDADTPDRSELREYNAIFWITGERDDNIFSEDDVANLWRYLMEADQMGGANLLLLGENILEYLDDEANDNVYAGPLLQELGIDEDSIESDAVEPEALIGQEGNPLSHGLEYHYDGSNGMSTFDSYGDGEVLFKDEAGNNVASIYDDVDSEKKAVYMGLNLSRIEGPFVEEDEYDDWPAGDVELGSKNAVSELIYTTMWQFGVEDDRTELRVVDHDVVVAEDEYPHTGRSYEVRTEIQNIGNDGASAMIRIEEGGDSVGLETIHIEGASRDSEPGSNYFHVDPGTSTMETSWTPREAGIRDIRVRVDPLRRTEEISPNGGESEDNKLMEFHNQAFVEEPVYFFHDEAETGEQWSHDTTEANIDGTGALDFVDDPDETGVAGDWDDDYSGMTEWAGMDEDDGYWETDDDEVSDFTDKAHYSSPRSSWMPETRAGGTGEREPIDMVLVLDTSGSMTQYGEGDWWYHAYQATKEVARELEEEDRFSIYIFRGENPESQITFQQFDAHGYCLSEDDQDEFIDEVIDGNHPDFYDLGDEDTYSHWTPLYDTVSRAIEELDYSKEHYPDRVRAAILFTDGAGNYDNNAEKYEPGIGRFEADTYGPGNYYDEELDYSGLLGADYNFMSVTLGHLTRDARLHSISASTGGENSFGVFEEEPENLAPLFAMYTASIVEESEGGIRSVDSNQLTNDDGRVEADFSVFSDSFMGGIENPGHVPPEVETLEEWETVYDFDNWHPDGFDIEEAGDGDNFRMATAYDHEDELTHHIDPSETLDDLQGEVKAVEGVELNWEFYTPDSGWPSYDNAELAIEVNGETVAEGLEQTESYGTDQPWVWEYEDITEYIDDPEEDTFDIRFIHDPSGDDGEPLHIGHVNVLYTLDFEADTGPSPEQTTSLESDESLSTSNDLHGYDDSVIETTIPYPYYRYTTTPAIEVPETRDEKLSFRTKYWMTQGTNGGFMYLWRSEDGEWEWEKNNRLYISPDQSYTGNLDFEQVEEESHDGGLDITGDQDDPEDADGLIDSNESLPYWSFNGKSGGGTFDWEYISVDLTRYDDFLIDQEEVRVVFVMAQMGGVTEDGHEPEMGWYIDNVRTEVTRDAGDEVPDDELGYWMRVNQTQAQSYFPGAQHEYYIDSRGDPEGKFWMYAANNTGEPVLPEGVDSSLYTSMIDLSNAESPVLEADMRFNINYGGGRPPDGLRVEISDDDGRSWNTLTYGVRAGWNYTGYGCEYSGDSIREGGDVDDGTNYGWVESTSLRRLNTDLSDWRGQNVRLRFRVFTNETDMYANDELPKPVFIDNVTVTEEAMEIDPETTSARLGDDAGLHSNEETREDLADRETFYENHLFKPHVQEARLPGIDDLRSNLLPPVIEKQITPFQADLERRALQ